MSNNNTARGTTGGMGITTILFIIFLVLKLTGNIDWSWLWVTSPVWIPWIFVLLLVAIVIPASDESHGIKMVFGGILFLLIAFTVLIMLALAGTVSMITGLAIGLPALFITLIISAIVYAVVKYNSQNPSTE